jgi:hypothetical protein
MAEQRIRSPTIEIRSKSLDCGGKNDEFFLAKSSGERLAILGPPRPVNWLGYHFKYHDFIAVCPPITLFPSSFRWRPQKSGYPAKAFNQFGTDLIKGTRVERVTGVVAKRQ